MISFNNKAGEERKKQIQDVNYIFLFYFSWVIIVNYVSFILYIVDSELFKMNMYRYHFNFST